jgi:hypothetical protein
MEINIARPTTKLQKNRGKINFPPLSIIAVIFWFAGFFEFSPEHLPLLFELSLSG